MGTFIDVGDKIPIVYGCYKVSVDEITNSVDIINIGYVDDMSSLSAAKTLEDAVVKKFSKFNSNLDFSYTFRTNRAMTNLGILRVIYINLNINNEVKKEVYILVPKTAEIKNTQVKLDTSSINLILKSNGIKKRQKKEKFEQTTIGGMYSLWDYTSQPKVLHPIFGNSLEDATYNIGESLKDSKIKQYIEKYNIVKDDVSVSIATSKDEDCEAYWITLLCSIDKLDINEQYKYCITTVE